MNFLTQVLIEARRPEYRFALDDATASLVIRQARAADLLAHLDHVLDGRIATNVSPRFSEHLAAARVLVKKQHQTVHWEITQLKSAVQRTGAPMVLLKGSAYIAKGILSGKGRMLGDIDILVPRGALQDVENALKKSGYFPKDISDYDKRYYREWSHEIPPVVHFNRHTTVDIHHSILPPTTRLKPDARLLLADAEPLPGHEDVYTLSPQDMILHSACHLFHEGELQHGLRDLLDIHALLGEFMIEERDWLNLLARARQLDLRLPLYYALHYASRLLQTPVPPAILEELTDDAPNRLVRGIQDWCFEEAFEPDHPSCQHWYSGIALFLLYLRAHYLRMPIHMLVPHLFYKAFLAPYHERRREEAKTRRQQQLQG